MQNPPIFAVVETSQPGHSLLTYQEPGTTHRNRIGSHQMPTQIARHLADAANGDELARLRDFARAVKWCADNLHDSPKSLLQRLRENVAALEESP